MQYLPTPAQRRLLLIAMLPLAGAATGADEPWPERVARVEDMPTLPPYVTIEVPGSRPRGEISRPVVLRLHVDAQGVVRRAVLLEGSGSPGHDLATLQALRRQRFQPYLVDGEPVDVTLVLPIHLPRPKYPQRP